MQLKKKLADPNLRLSMEICTIPSAVVTQALAAAGSDAVIIDQEHGAIGREMLHSMIAATAGTDCAPLVRIVENTAANVKAALDMGAEGIVFPLVKSAAEVEDNIAMLRYPPRGIRGWGPFIGHSRWQVPAMEYLSTHGDDTICCLLIETVEAVENIDAIFAVDGVDCAFVAQFDLSANLGIFGQFGNEAFKNAVNKVETAAMRAGVPLGGGPVRCAEDAAALFAKGYRILGGFDILRLKAAVATSVEWAKSKT